MKNQKTKISLIILASLLISTFSLAQAVPPIPSGFYGTVKVDGENVPVGTAVSAWIAGVEYASTTTIMYQGESVYNLIVPGDDPDTQNVIEGGTQNATIHFKIGNLEATPTGNWHSGTNVNHPISATTGEVKFRFEDVSPGIWADYIYRLFDSGITKGCSEEPPLFCPNKAVTRAEMAVFLLRGLNEPGYLPPSGTGDVFEDVDDQTWGADWIEAFYAEGYTKGCSDDPLMYCPAEPITRAQMAVFLLRIKYGQEHTPPHVAESSFDDVDYAVDWIEQLYNDKITSGCSEDPLLFCPGKAVTRAEMAVFLVRIFDLP